MNIQQIIFDGGGTLRSGWRVALFLFVFILTLIFVQISGYGLLHYIYAGSEPPGSAFMLTYSVTGLAAALFAGWVCGRLIEKIPFRGLGASFTRHWLRNLLAGIGLGAATFIIAIAVAFIFGGLRFQFNTADTQTIAANIAFTFFLFSVAAAWEEALFRGYIFQTLTRSGLALFAIAMTAAFFGFVHLGNPDSGFISTLNTMLAGVWFGIAYLKSRDLWFVTGLHLMWNFTQGSIFGIEVSGLKDITTAPLLNEIDSGPAWLTGGDYGIEASISATIAIILSAAAIYFLPIAKPDEELLAINSPKMEQIEG